MAAALFPSQLCRALSVSLVKQSSISSCRVGRVELRGKVSVALKDPLELAEVEYPFTPPTAQIELIVVPTETGLELVSRIDEGALVFPALQSSLPQAFPVQPFEPANRSCSADIFWMY